MSPQTNYWGDMSPRFRRLCLKMMKKEQAEEAKRVEQRTSKCLHKQLAEQAQLETVQMAEQETARQLISEASEKLSEAVQGTGNNLQGANVAQAAKCGQWEVECQY